MTPDSARHRLEAGIGPIRDLLAGRQFAAFEEDGVSPAGPFAGTCFRRGSITIGVILRREGLGCPTYSIGSGDAGHSDLMAALGSGGDEALVSRNGLIYRDRDAGDPFAALLADLRDRVLPVLDRSEAGFHEVVERALGFQRERQRW